MAGVFGQSLYATGGRVAGLNLLPFSPHHALLLIEIDSPYIKGGEVGIGDTTAALIACRSRRSDGVTGILKLSNSVMTRICWRLWWVFHSHDKVDAALSDYITASVKHPEVWASTEASDGKSTGAPWPYYIVSVIAQEMPSIPYADLWDMPLTELACHKAIIDERGGGAEIAESDLAKLRAAKESD